MECRRLMVAALAFLALVCWENSQAQVAIEKALKLSRLDGVVYDRSGVVVADATVSLIQAGNTVQLVSTDRSGHFRIEPSGGKYLLQVTAPQHASVTRDVDVVGSAEMPPGGSNLYILLGPAACSDDCSSIFTSRKKLNEQLQNYQGPSRR